MAKKNEARRKPSAPPNDRRGKKTASKKSRLPSSPAVESNKFPIVGIGASAGGLEALKDLFDNIPDNPGLAFVVIQHLDPTKSSLTPELLDKHTSMRVTQATADVPIALNHVYVIPPNKYLGISKGVLQLIDPDRPRGARVPIDFFLRMLADDQKQRAIGVILSGSGTDGTLGIKAIKAAGGLVLAQAPAGAEHTGMPQSAIASGAVDHVLPTGKMAEVLLRYAQHPYVREAIEEDEEAEAEVPRLLGATGVPGTSEPDEDKPENLSKILSLIRARAKQDFRAYKTKTLVRRTRRRMCLRHLDDYDEYLDYLRTHPAEVDALVKDLLISVTDFFRDTEAWQELDERVIGPIINEKDDDEAIRIWVPGCATGEEPYSVAMLALEYLHEANKNCALQVFGSDVDADALDHARQGLYPNSIAADVPANCLKRFFTPKDDSHYLVSKVLRESVMFAEQNLIADPPFSKLDLICCRNLLIYLKPEIQEKLVALFHFALREGGYLFLGSSETTGRHSDIFETLSKRWRIYRRIGSPQYGKLEIPIRPAIPHREVQPRPNAAHHELHVAHLAQQRLLEWLSPAAVLIDTNWKILFISGEIDNYLTHKSGIPTDDVLTKARKGLRSKLRAAVHKALEVNRTITVEVRVQRDSTYRSVGLIVQPIHDREHDRTLILVVFEDVARGRQAGPIESSHAAASSSDAFDPSARLDSGPPARSGPTAAELDDDSVIRQLEDELATTKDDLQTTIEQLETSNEELKAANEEAMSINEELQSTNEELETSKEELQSLNEELNTVNNQLASKVEELETKHSDLENLIAVTDVATICLDTELCIRWFTPAVKRLIRVNVSDDGRPLSDLSHVFVDDDINEVAQAVLNKLVPQESEVRCQDNRHLIRRVTPYRTDGDRIGGVVLTFIDITALKQLNESLEVQIAERTELLRILQDITQAANQARTAEGAMHAALKRIADHNDWLLGHVYRRAKDGSGQLVSSGIWHVSDRFDKSANLLRKFQSVTSEARISPSDGLAARVLAGGLPQWFDGAAQFPAGLRGDAERLGLTAAIGFPVAVGGEVVAVLVFYSDHAIRRGDRFMEIMPHVGIQLGHMVERKRLEREIAEATTEQQRHFGRELHDSVSQQLTGIGMLVETLRQSLTESSSPLAADAATLVRHIQDAHEQVRRLSRGLMPVEVDAEGLMTALEELAENIGQTLKLDCTFRCEQPVMFEDNDTATHLYRIVQEAIQNAAKHGHPSRIGIMLETDQDDATLTVWDNGGGFPDKRRVHRGTGHRIMQYRADLIGAQLSIESDEQGVTVTCRIRRKH